MTRGDAQADPDHALVWYQVANTLDPHNGRILQKLAAADIKTGRDEDALRAATRSIAHGAGSSGYILKSQALFELDRTDQAIAAAKASRDQTQLGLGHAIAGDNAKLNDLIAHLGSSEAASKLSAMGHNHFSLAQALYAQGLLRSSGRILKKYQVESSQYYLLKAQIVMRLGRNQKASLELGRGLLEKGIALSPERTDLRRLLQTVDQKLGDTKAAGEQGSKLRALETGKV